MVDYSFSANVGKTITGFVVGGATPDKLVLATADGSSATVELYDTAAGLEVRGATGTVIIAGMTTKQITTSNFLLIDGSRILVGDNTSDTLLDDLSNTFHDTITGAARPTNVGDGIYGMDGADTIDGSQGADRIIAGAGSDSVISGASGGADTIYGNSGNDTVDGNGNSSQLIVAGGRDGDSLRGGSGNDNFFGNLGNDTLLGQAGSDTLAGGQDDDHIDGGAGDDHLFGDLGADSIVGSQADSVYGGAGNDTINLTAGGSATVLVYAGADADTVLGSAGADTIYGGAGNDTITNTTSGGGAAEGSDLLFGDLGADSIVAYDGSGNTSATIYGGGGNDVISTNFGAAADSLIAYGGDDSDTISGGTSNDTLYGDAGGDSVVGNAGNDTLVGGAGNDTLDGGAGADAVLGGDDADTIQSADDTGSADQIDGGAGNDLIRGALSGTTLAAAQDLGNDTIVTGEGADTVSLFLNSGGNDVLTINDLSSTDTLNLTVNGSTTPTLVGDNFTVTFASSSVTIDSAAAAAGDTIVLNNFSTSTLVNVTTATGGAVNQLGIINGSSGGTLSAGNSADLLVSGSAGDTLSGGNSADALHGNAGADSLNGGEGNDTLIGGSGSDSLTGGTGADRFQFVATTDSPDTDGQRDSITDFEDGTDFIRLNLTQETAFTLDAVSGANADTDGAYTFAGSLLKIGTDGTAGAEIAVGVNGTPTFTRADFEVYYTGTVADTTATTIEGGGGNDSIFAGGGADTIAGYAGADTITLTENVAAADRVLYTAVSESNSSAYDFIGTGLVLNGAGADVIDTELTVANLGTAVTGAVSAATLVANLNTLLNVGGGAGFNTAAAGTITAARITVNAGDLSGKDFIAIDADASDTFTSADYLFDVTGATFTSVATTNFV